MCECLIVNRYIIVQTTHLLLVTTAGEYVAIVELVGGKDFLHNSTPNYATRVYSKVNHIDCVIIFARI